MPLKMQVLLMGIYWDVIILIASCAIKPPINAAILAVSWSANRTLNTQCCFRKERYLSFVRCTYKLFAAFLNASLSSIASPSPSIRLRVSCSKRLTSVELVPPCAPEGDVHSFNLWFAHDDDAQTYLDIFHAYQRTAQLLWISSNNTCFHPFGLCLLWKVN